MVTSATGFGRNGVSDWLVQRVSAVVLAIYTVVIFGWFAFHGGSVDFTTWQGLNQCLAMRVLNSIVLLSLVGHSWVGIWTIITDYMTAARMAAVGLGNYATFIRLACEVATIFWLLGCLIWGGAIIWAGA